MDKLVKFPGRSLGHVLSHDLEDRLERLIVAVERLVAALESKQPRHAQEQAGRTRRPGNRLVMAESFIEITLRLGGPMTWEQVEEKAKGKHAPRTLLRARDKMAAGKSSRGAVEKVITDGRHFWRLRRDLEE